MAWADRRWRAVLKRDWNYRTWLDAYTGMSILIVVLVALILLGLALYAVQRSPIPSPVNWLIQLVLIVIAIWFIGTRAGFF
jgi:steroid 5-alpha reductase family enzyme